MKKMKTVKGENMTAEERHKLLTQEEKAIYWRHQKAKNLYKELVPHFYEATYGKDEAASSKVELRSEKVRNIIGQVPPAFLRNGIVIISLSLLMLVGIAAIIPYQPGIRTNMNITKDWNGVFEYSAKIPYSALKDSAMFAEVVMGREFDTPLPTHYLIDSISKKASFSRGTATYSAALHPKKACTVEVDAILLSMSCPAKIKLKKKSVLMWMVGKVRE